MSVGKSNTDRPAKVAGREPAPSTPPERPALMTRQQSSGSVSSIFAELFAACSHDGAARSAAAAKRS